MIKERRKTNDPLLFLIFFFFYTNPPNVVRAVTAVAPEVIPLFFS